MKHNTARVGGAIAALLLAAAGAQAQMPRGQHYDSRYSHNHYYANRGVFVGAVPGRPYVVGGGRYYYSGGVWYGRRGPGFVVIGPPIGVFVPVLPPYYTTVWVGGIPYYYSNDAYYTWNPNQNGYEVVAPPDAQADAESPATTQPPPSDDLFIYPQSGQPPDQQSNDKFECHKWANSQTGYDPTQSQGGVSPDEAAEKRTAYQRSMRACLEGRGYSVR